MRYLPPIGKIFLALISGLIVSISITGTAIASDFSRNPFSESERALARTRASAVILNQTPASTNSNLSGVVIGAPTRVNTFDDTTIGGGVFNPAASLGYIPSYGYGISRPFWNGRAGWGGWGGPRGWGIPGTSFGLGAAINNFAFGGYGGFSNPYYGYGFSGYGGYGGYNGWNSWGWGPDPELGEMGSSPMVFDNTPSKSSGNYYAPSTPDSSASGSYYSNTGPSISMPIKPYTTPKNYWGPSGSPLPKDINKVPW